MNEKHLKIFAGVFIALLLLFFVTKPRKSAVNVDEFVQNIIIGVDKENIHQVEIYKNTDSEPAKLQFQKQNDRWYITNHYFARVQKSKMDRMLDNLLEMTGKVRATGEQHFDNFKISDEQGIHVLLKDDTDKTLANLIIGKKAEDMASGFLRFSDFEKIYFVDQNILSDLSIYGDIDTLTQFKKSTFVDLQAVDEKTEDLQQVALVVNRKEMVIKKVEKEVEVMQADSIMGTELQTEWVHVKGSKEIALDKSEVDKFLKDMTRIRAKEVVDHLGGGFSDMNKSNKYGVGRPTSYVILEDKDGQRKNIIFGKWYDREDGLYMQVQWEGTMYKLAKSNYEKITKWSDELPNKVKEDES